MELDFGLTKIIKAILNDEHEILTISTFLSHPVSIVKTIVTKHNKVNNFLKFFIIKILTIVISLTKYTPYDRKFH